MADLLTIDEAAELLTVSRRTVYAEHRRGRLAFVKVASRTRVRRSECERYLRAREQSAA
jgi:excisionase family DNA binding protein